MRRGNNASRGCRVVKSMKHGWPLHAAAVPVTIIGLFVSVVAMGGGHGDGSYLPLIAVFPFAALLMATNLPVFALAAACFQFSIYAAAINHAAKNNCLQFLLYGLVTIHVLAVMLLLFVA